VIRKWRFNFDHFSVYTNVKANSEKAEHPQACRRIGIAPFSLIGLQVPLHSLLDWSEVSRRLGPPPLFCPSPYSNTRPFQTAFPSHYDAHRHLINCPLAVLLHNLPSTRLLHHLTSFAQPCILLIMQVLMYINPLCKEQPQQGL